MAGLGFWADEVVAGQIRCCWADWVVVGGRPGCCWAEQGVRVGFVTLKG